MRPNTTVVNRVLNLFGYTIQSEKTNGLSRLSANCFTNPTFIITLINKVASSVPSDLLNILDFNEFQSMRAIDSRQLCRFSLSDISGDIDSFNPVALAYGLKSVVDSLVFMARNLRYIGNPSGTLTITQRISIIALNIDELFKLLDDSRQQFVKDIITIYSSLMTKRSFYRSLVNFSHSYVNDNDLDQLISNLKGVYAASSQYFGLIQSIVIGFDLTHNFGTSYNFLFHPFIMLQSTLNMRN